MTADTLRGRVVLLVLSLIGLISVGLYAFIGALLWRRGVDAVPDALWLAAGTYGGALVTWLVNSKGSSPQDVQVINDAGSPVPVDTA